MNVDFPDSPVPVIQIQTKFQLDTVDVATSQLIKLCDDPAIDNIVLMLCSDWKTVLLDKKGMETAEVNGGKKIKSSHWRNSFHFDFSLKNKTGKHFIITKKK